jgi:hypothetical protein
MECPGGEYGTASIGDDVAETIDCQMKGSRNRREILHVEFAMAMQVGTHLSVI